MNLRNKYAVITVRTLLGLLFVFSGISGLMSGPEMSGVPESMAAFSKVMWSIGVFQMIKITELIAGAMLVLNMLPALAAIFLAPICIGIIVVNMHVAPVFVISGLVVSIPNAYLGYVYWDKYKALFERK